MFIMGVVKFNIILDSPTGIFYSGTRVVGKIILLLDKPKKIRGVRIKIQGKASVSWHHEEAECGRRNSSETRPHRRIYYSAEEKYFTRDYFLLGCGNGKIELVSGEHVYPFSADLPLHIPTSFEGKHGYVRYTITARIVRPWMLDIKDKITFQVFSHLNLNYHPTAKAPINVREEKTFLKLFNSTNGPLIMVVSLPQSGYVSGQDIPISLKIINGSNVVISSILIKITKVITWIVRTPRTDSKSYKTIISRKILEGVEAKGSRTFLEIMNLNCTKFINLESCSIINEFFYLKIKACVSGVCHKGLSVKIPLIVGTIPIQKRQQEQFIHPQWNNSLPNSNSCYSSTFSQDPPPYSVAVGIPPPEYNVPYVPWHSNHCGASMSYVQNAYLERIENPETAKIYPTAPLPD